MINPTANLSAKAAARKAVVAAYWWRAMAWRWCSATVFAPVEK